jgi:hypothetical protein
MTAALEFPTNKIARIKTGISLVNTVLSRPFSWAAYIEKETDPNAPHLSDWQRKFRLANHENIMRGLNKIRIAEAAGIPTFFGMLRLVKKANGISYDYGLVSCRMVTNVGVGFIVDAFQNIVELETMKYHGIGTGTNAEAQGDTALQTELSTQYNPNSTRATGTQTENGSNVYRSVGTNAVDASVAITEHGMFSDPTPGSGVLLDRSVFAAINLVSGNSLQSTWDMTLTAGS